MSEDLEFSTIVQYCWWGLCLIALCMAGIAGLAYAFATLNSGLVASVVLAILLVVVFFSAIHFSPFRRQGASAVDSLGLLAAAGVAITSAVGVILVMYIALVSPPSEQSDLVLRTASKIEAVERFDGIPESCTMHGCGPHILNVFCPITTIRERKRCDELLDSKAEVFVSPDGSVKHRDYDNVFISMLGVKKVNERNHCRKQTAMLKGFSYGENAFTSDHYRDSKAFSAVGEVCLSAHRLPTCTSDGGDGWVFDTDGYSSCMDDGCRDLGSPADSTAHRAASAGLITSLKKYVEIVPGCAVQLPIFITPWWNTDGMVAACIKEKLIGLAAHLGTDDLRLEFLAILKVCQFFS